MATAVVRVALARDESVGFERVQQRHEDARVDARPLDQLSLREAAVVMQKPQDLKLPRLEAVRGMGSPKTAHRLISQQGEEQAWARAMLFEDADRGGRGGRHLDFR